MIECEAVWSDPLGYVYTMTFGTVSERAAFLSSFPPPPPRTSYEPAASAAGATSASLKQGPSSAAKASSVMGGEDGSSCGQSAQAQADQQRGPFSQFSDGYAHCPP